MRTAAFRLMLAVTVLGFGGHALLLPVLPLWVSRAGSGEFGAGATTGVFMLTTVLTQLAVPWLLRVLGYRAVFASGLVLLAAPTPFVLGTAELGPVLALNAVRGIGFGLITVAGSALVAELVPPAEHGRASSRYGLAIGIPGLALLPLGVATVDALGFTGVFWTATASPLLAALLVPFLRATSPTPRRHASDPGVEELARSEAGVDRVSPDPVAGRRAFVLAGLGPMAAMLAGSVAQGGLTTFLPLVAPGAGVAVPVALFALALGGVLGRGVAGPLVDRRGPGRLLLPGGVLSALGMGVELLAVGLSPWLLVPGALAVGLGFGLVQNDSLVALFAAAGPARYGAASAAWNIGFDAGTGAGASGLGAVAQPFGFRAAFGVAALLLLATTPLTRRRSSPTP
ncbi:MFS transporter [Pseudonocardia oroxyli]|uniref:Predicted arabinose efflux permease, MFS family n=1 Tax=Pseudonocardia oroxyli TaxID=366584 RepID=A0A1G7RVL5_PSEOR|nr:MFS transporter [Pseudonocardia oroxyli]SDG13820.1 Predicted arabinose efflux permease, MFS family [Pseudonocardia oroxyli]